MTAVVAIAMHDARTAHHTYLALACILCGSQACEMSAEGLCLLLRPRPLPPT